MRHYRRKSLFFGILLLVIGLGIGYAFLTTTLNIEGTANIDSNTWDVYWNNVQVTPGSVSADTPVIDSNKTSVSFQVHLSQPGDYYSFTVDAVNDGSIDTMIDTVVTSNFIPDYIDFEVTYSDDLPLLGKQLLKAGETEVYHVMVRYRTDIDAAQLPDMSSSLPLVFGISYVQSNSTSQDVRHIVYYTGNQSYYFGDMISLSAENTYDNYQDAVTAFGGDTFIKYTTLGDGSIYRADIGFFVGEQLYYITGDQVGAYYEQNKEVLDQVYGAGVCNETFRDGNRGYSCTKTINSKLYVSMITSLGYAYSYVERYACGVDVQYTESYCVHNS